MVALEWHLCGAHLTHGACHADRFVVVTHALEERRTPGNTLIVQPDQPWQVRF